MINGSVQIEIALIRSHSLFDEGDVGVAGEPGAVVVPAGEGLVAASPGQPVLTG
jgi:hypothetical protein